MDEGAVARFDAAVGRALARQGEPARGADRRYRVLFEHAPVPQAITRPRLPGVFANPAFAEQFGYDRDALLGVSFGELVHPDDRSQQHRDHEQMARGEIAGVDTARRYVRRDGSVFFGHVRVNVATSADGTPEFFVGTILDVTAAVEANAEMAAREERLRILFDNSPDIVAVLCPDGRWDTNDQGPRLLGYPLGHDFPEGILGLIHPDDRSLADAALAEVAAGTRAPTEPVTLRLAAADGSYRHFECAGRNLTADPLVGGVLVTARDVSERVRADAARRSAEVRFQRTFEHAPMIVSLVAGDVIVDINEAGCAVLGRRHDDMVGTSAMDTVHPDDLERAIGATLRQLAGDPTPAEFRLVAATGREIWVMSSAVVLPGIDDEQELILTMQADISDRKALEQQLAYQATHDPLTGLLNRSAFLTHVEHALLRRNPAQYAVAFLDLDGFKPVNDTFGHEAGDAVLVTLAQRLRAVARAGDAIARLGGDEFVALCEIAGPEGARVVGERFRAAVEAPVLVGGVQVEVGVSVGVTVATTGDDAAALLRRADQATYTAKRDGGGRVAVV
jgi:diguanylate cyclase (GGDEF)-like protein/PAS domain S-box-containing protein